jgi:type IV pilus assembly protein PilB
MTRLIDMGIKPFLVASSIQAIMAQRLIRILHDPSKQLAEESDIDPKHLRLIGLSKEDAIGKVYKPMDHPDAPGGFKGRRAIFELLQMNSELRDLAFKMAPVAELRKAALSAGMKPLVEDGRKKVLRGMTTPAEVARVSQVEDF